MADVKDGGPVSPRQVGHFGPSGMSLRQWFAGQALAGLLANPHRVFERWPKHVVRDAYDLADEMVKAGEATHGD